MTAHEGGIYCIHFAGHIQNTKAKSVIENWLYNENIILGRIKGENWSE